MAKAAVYSNTYKTKENPDLHGHSPTKSIYLLTLCLTWQVILVTGVSYTSFSMSCSLYHVCYFR